MIRLVTWKVCACGDRIAGRTRASTGPPRAEAWVVADGVVAALWRPSMPPTANEEPATAIMIAAAATAGRTPTRRRRCGIGVNIATEGRPSAAARSRPVEAAIPAA